jgi:hypothetical protein
MHLFQSSGLLYCVFCKLFTNVSEEKNVHVPVNMHTEFSCEIPVAIHHATRCHCLEHNINISWCEGPPLWSSGQSSWLQIQRSRL